VLNAIGAILWGFFAFLMWVAAIITVKSLAFFFGPVYWWLLAFPAVGTFLALVALVKKRS
jgi:uncharacterized protein YaaW (UPF0174 family)